MSSFDDMDDDDYHSRFVGGSGKAPRTGGSGKTPRTGGKGKGAIMSIRRSPSGKTSGEGSGKGSVRSPRRFGRSTTTKHAFQKPAIMRLAKRGGVGSIVDKRALPYRIEGELIRTMQIESDEMIKNIITVALIYMDHERRKTITAADIVNAVKQVLKRSYYSEATSGL